MATYPQLKVESANVRYLPDGHVESDYEYEHVRCELDAGANTLKAKPVKTQITFKTQSKAPKTGVMLVGWGGNNGTTLTGAILANKHKMSFETKDGKVEANYFGSVTQASTIFVGVDEATNADMYVPLKDIVPMVAPNELVLDGWDISGHNMAEAMVRARVFDVSLQAQLKPLMAPLKPRRAIFDPKFVAANQAERADNCLPESMSKWQQVEQVRADIEQFKRANQLDKVIVLWTANTERYSDHIEGVHDTADNLLAAIKRDESELAPSALYAVAAILSGSAYINGSPQNTFCAGLIELAERHQTFIGGDDFKSGQTKFKSVLVDFLVSAGIKPCSIVSYNHLGNNDGYNLSAPQQFRSKEISKSSVVDDMVHSNQLLYGKGLAHPDHCIVIKYVPYVADSKRAMDEYISELMLGGKNTLVVHNTCEDSLLAAPLIIDLILVTELCQRVAFRVHNPNKVTDFQSFNAVLSVLSYMCKAPLVERGAKVTNALFKQRACLENLLRALVSLPPINHMDFEHKLSRKADWYEAPVGACVQEPIVNRSRRYEIQQEMDVRISKQSAVTAAANEAGLSKSKSILGNGAPSSAAAKMTAGH
ncbi:Inositol-3-phosphate synthase 1-B [Fragariocoptes setiger]|uniref:inositol-3-phosphate synthase n=1 Tax=Fragariocoptes setiger TaxID=1670756 RepID=A0ABQ7S783_9ACAR|nr:Inositol-3-phosphate synthase 1-B [Fragariocoptes setiger]